MTSNDRPVRVCTVTTPIGPFTAVATVDAHDCPVVLASGWTAEPGELIPLISPRPGPARLEVVSAIAGVTDRVLAYHEGDVHAIDDVVVQQVSGPFIGAAWAALRAVPAGHRVTYTQLASRAGRPRAARAAGSACSRNAAALFVPCHRAVPAAGGVGWFRWGPPVKRWLLAHEAGDPDA